jgi:hypothetical protein
MADGTAQQALLEYRWAKFDGGMLNLKNDSFNI